MLTVTADNIVIIKLTILDKCVSLLKLANLQQINLLTPRSP